MAPQTPFSLPRTGLGGRMRSGPPRAKAMGLVGDITLLKTARVTSWFPSIHVPANIENGFYRRPSRDDSKFHKGLAVPSPFSFLLFLTAAPSVPSCPLSTGRSVAKGPLHLGYLLRWDYWTTTPQAALGPL